MRIPPHIHQRTPHVIFKHKAKNHKMIPKREVIPKHKVRRAVPLGAEAPPLARHQSSTLVQNLERGIAFLQKGRCDPAEAKLIRDQLLHALYALYPERRDWIASRLRRNFPPQELDPQTAAMALQQVLLEVGEEKKSRQARTVEAEVKLASKLLRSAAQGTVTKGSGFGLLAAALATLLLLDALRQMVGGKKR